MRFDRLQRRPHGGVQRLQRFERHFGERRRNRVLVGLRFALGRLRQAGRQLDVAQAEGAVLPAPHERGAPEAVDDGHRIGERIECGSPEHGVLVYQGKHRGPVLFQPVGGTR
jgi:hypothetical protein